jgi:hypothetical protein
MLATIAFTGCPTPNFMTGGATDRDYTAEYDIGIDRERQPEEVGNYHICPHRPSGDWASIGVLG